jgi:MraZ protein
MGFDRCLYLFLPSQWERILTDNKDDLQLRDKRGQRALKRFLFSNAMEAPPDDQGRILISQRFKEHAGLKKEVVILGSGTKAEIWDKRAHASQNASAQRLFRRLSDKLDL